MRLLSIARLAKCRHSIKHLMVALAVFSLLNSCFFTLTALFWGRNSNKGKSSSWSSLSSDASRFKTVLGNLSWCVLYSGGITCSFKAVVLEMVEAQKSLRLSFVKVLASDGDSERNGDIAIARWTEAVSAFLSSRGDVGWGRRTGGVILAARAETICGVQFEGNTLRMKQHYPRLAFQPNLKMLAGGGDDCKSQLKAAITSGWHQGQIFFYRLSVDRPGHYSVRMTVILYNQDEKRGDGVLLGLDDLLQVRVQCVNTKGRYVMEPAMAGEDGVTVAVVEVQTVALGGEILLELEGIYTCVGLSLIETFLHDDQDTSGGSLHNRVEIRQVPVPQLGQTKNATELARLREVWAVSEGVCAESFRAEASMQRKLQHMSSSVEAAGEQRYFNEWAKRERLEQSAGRYCRPRQAPRSGEPGWTWAGKSTRAEREAEALLARADASRKAQEAIAATYRDAVQAAMAAGASPRAAELLASEAVSRAVMETKGIGISEEAQRSAVERVVEAAKYTANNSASGDLSRSNQAEVILDMGRRRRRRRLSGTNIPNEVITTSKSSSRRIAGFLRARETAGAGAMGAGVKTPLSPAGERPAMEAWEPIASNERTPPPLCPPRLADLMEEALRIAAATPSLANDWNPTWSALTDGAAAAAERARARSQGASGRSASGDGWRKVALPKWLGSVLGRGRGLERRNLAKRALGSGFEAVAAFRAHDLEWPGRESSGVDGERTRVLEGGGGGGGLQFPLHLMGFTWDGATVVMKEVVPGCARVAQPVTPAFADASTTHVPSPRSGSEWLSLSGDPGDSKPLPGGDGQEARTAGGKRDKKQGGQNDEGVSGDVVRTGGDGEKRACLSVEAMVVPTTDIVVDIIVPVSAGLVPRLLTLLPQMERLAKGASCAPLPPDHPLAPTCVDSEYYPPAFWPDRLSRRGQQAAAPSSMDTERWSQPEFGTMNATEVESGATPSLRRGGHAGQGAGGNGRNLRVIVATDDPGVERLLKQYDVDMVYVATQTPFSKARAIQDASAVIPDNKILLIHDADLFPPCGLPDALRQTVVQGVQAVNLLLPYETQSPGGGSCLYPLSTFGPMAIYKSDFTAVGGIEDTNSGRWGFEDTAFLHKVMLGDTRLGVLRVHLPGLVHKWHEITPWKCLVWVWDGSASASVVDGADGDKVELEDPPDSPAQTLGA